MKFDKLWLVRLKCLRDRSVKRENDIISRFQPWLMTEGLSRWRLAGCATNSPLITLDPSHKYINLFIKYTESTASTGYTVLLSDFCGRLWRETLTLDAVQERLELEASGLEIEPTDFLKLLDQMCQALTGSTCELSSDSQTLSLKAAVKIGFIKLKWNFKAEICPRLEYDQMIRNDFLLPFFANFRDDKTVQEDVDSEGLDSFYGMMTNLRILPRASHNTASTETPIEFTETSIDSQATLTPPQAEEPLSAPLNVPVVDEEGKRRELEEQLQASKKKKKKLI